MGLSPGFKCGGDDRRSIYLDVRCFEPPGTGDARAGTRAGARACLNELIQGKYRNDTADTLGGSSPGE